MNRLLFKFPASDHAFRLKHFIFFLIIMGLGIFFRFYNLTQSPCWYGDECTELIFCQDFSRGQYCWGGRIYKSFLPHYTYSPPMYTWMCSWFTSAFGENIFVARAYTSIFAVLTIPVLLILTGIIAGSATALVATLFFAIQPLAVIFNRYGFRHNQSMFFNLLFFTGILILVRDNKKNTTFMALFLGAVAGMSIFTSFRTYPVFFFLLYYLFRFFDRKKTILALGLFFLPGFLMYLPIIVRDGTTFFTNFLHDFFAIFQGAPMMPGDPFFVRFKGMINDFLDLYSYDLVTFFSFAGMLVWVQKEKAGSHIFVLFLILFSAIVHKQTNLRLFSYPALLILPMFSAGAALFAKYCYERLGSASKIIGFLKILLFFTVIIVSVFLMISMSWNTCKGTQKVSLWAFSVKTNQDTIVAARYLNRNTVKDDLVIADPQLSWMLNCRRTTIEQSMGYELRRFPPYFTRPMYHSRFRYDVSFKNAKYLVISDGQDEFHIFKMAKGIIGNYVNKKIKSSDWVLLKKIGEYKIYFNIKK